MIRKCIALSVVIAAAVAIASCSASGKKTAQTPAAKAKGDAIAACIDLQTKVRPNATDLANAVNGIDDRPVMDAVRWAIDSAQQATAVDASWMPFLAYLQDLSIYLTVRADGGPDAAHLATDLTPINATCTQLGQPL